MNIKKISQHMASFQLKIHRIMQMDTLKRFLSAVMVESIFAKKFSSMYTTIIYYLENGLPE